MSKYLKVLFVVMYAMFLFSSSASAAILSGCNQALDAAGNCGTTIINITSANASIATELVGSTTSYTLTGTSGLFIAYNASNAFAINDLITFTIANGAVTNTSMVLCGNSSAGAHNPVGTLISATDGTIGVSTLTFRFDNATTYLSTTPVGNLIWVSGNSTATACAQPFIGGPALTAKIPASMASGTTLTVSISATTGGGTAITGAAASATTYFTVVNQITQTRTADTAAIDFVTGRVNIIPSGSVTAGLIDTMSTAWVTTNGAVTFAYTPTTSDKLDITLAGSMSGISRICFNDATCASTSTTKFTISTTTATYSVSLATVPGAGAVFADFDKVITFVVDGTTVLSPRSFTLSTVYNAASGSILDRTLSNAVANYYTLTLASYQAIIPYISANSTYKTICFINNGYTLAAPAVVDILATESGATLLTNQSIGSIGVGRTTRVDFDSNITPYTWTSGAETVGTALPLTGLNASDRYSAMVTVNAAAANVTMNCIQLDPAGSKRAVPVLSTANGWAQ